MCQLSYCWSSFAKNRKKACIILPGHCGLTIQPHKRKIATMVEKLALYGTHTENNDDRKKDTR
jgi:hypothetical protein